MWGEDFEDCGGEEFEGGCGGRSLREDVGGGV